MNMRFDLRGDFGTNALDGGKIVNDNQLAVQRFTREIIR